MQRPLRLLLLIAGLCTPMVVPVAQAQAPHFDGEHAFMYLRKQVDFGPRAPGSTAHEECLAWMIAHLKEKADELTPHSFTLPDPYRPEPLRLTNLKASFRPELDRRIALAAHWDSRPRADQQDSSGIEIPIDGANDGASGVAVLLAVADLLHEITPPVGVDLLFFDGEDYGREGDLEHYLLGSRRFVADFPGYQPEALILLDMVGDRKLRIPMEGYGLRAAPGLTQLVFDRATALGLPAFDPVPGRPIFDDHLPFLQAGIRAVNLIDFDYPSWHTHHDTVEQCSAESLEQVGRLLLALLWEDFAR